MTTDNEPKFATVDDEDYDYLMQWEWHYFNGYAVRPSEEGEGEPHLIYMHEVVAARMVEQVEKAELLARTIGKRNFTQ